MVEGSWAPQPPKSKLQPNIDSAQCRGAPPTLLSPSWIDSQPPPMELRTHSSCKVPSPFSSGPDWTSGVGVTSRPSGTSQCLCFDLRRVHAASVHLSVLLMKCDPVWNKRLCTSDSLRADLESSYLDCRTTIYLFKKARSDLDASWKKDAGCH